MPLERTDRVLLGAYLLAAALGTWTSALLVNDGVVFLTAGWLGDSWNLYFRQDADRVVSMLLTYGPAWALRAAFAPSAGVYMTLAHLFYFAVPVALWLALRAFEPHRLFSRLYLASALALIYFPTEQIAGVGIWLMWLALVTTAGCTTRRAIALSLAFGVVLGLTHPSIAMMSLLYLAAGVALTLFGRPLPRVSLVAAAVMSVVLIVAWLLTSRFLAASNPTVIAQLAVNRFDYIDPRWLLASMALFPMLAVLWLLVLAPGAESARLRWRLSPPVLLVVGAVGLWFAAAGIVPQTWMYARHSAPHVFALALALALVAPATWLVQAERPLMLYASVAAVAIISYNVDLALFGRFVDRHLKPGAANVAELKPEPWPPRYDGPSARQILMKWAAGPDYVRDVVVPVYDWHRVTLAFYSFFRSDRRSFLFHRLGERGDWLPYECAVVESVKPRDAADAAFLKFLAAHYCVK